ncbi:hypothetical protein DV515_00016266 [Chloebia gouldiae]|uniref:Uncharacterized protein n=1 Tax=Chloebia gouldiae TaxID=44316 RepID=A0A3L8RSZ9_CHLGU|nr:hypothetical protein DV515_00016266 [Chloebia gouldiae]
MGMQGVQHFLIGVQQTTMGFLTTQEQQDRDPQGLQQGRGTQHAVFWHTLVQHTDWHGLQQVWHGSQQGFWHGSQQIPRCPGVIEEPPMDVNFGKTPCSAPSHPLAAISADANDHIVISH